MFRTLLIRSVYKRHPASVLNTIKNRLPHVKYDITHHAKLLSIDSTRHYATTNKVENNSKPTTTTPIIQQPPAAQQPTSSPQKASAVIPDQKQKQPDTTDDSESSSTSLFGRKISTSEVFMLKSLLSTIWPKNKPSFKIRVAIAFSLLIGAKLLNVQVPFFFKSIIDQMNVDFSSVGTAGIAIGSMIFAYGGARFGAVLFGELRNAVFASVSQSAIKRVAYNTFVRLLHMDLNFHLSRQTGGLTRAIDRGTKGISYVLSAMVFHIIPITFEITMVCGILSYNYGVPFAAVTFFTMLAYSIFTIKTTSWRTNFRRQANNADNKAASVALDSLINYEAVKYFNN